MIRVGAEFKILKHCSAGSAPFYLTTVPIIHTAEALVDGRMWHTIRVTPQVAECIVTQPRSQYQELIPNIERIRRAFDVSDELYTFLLLKFP